MYDTITEGKACIKVPSEKKISKDLPVFYNPIMKLNRDISIILLNSITDKNLQISLPLAGSGVRGIRFLKELKSSKIRSIFLNDRDKESFKIIKKNLSLNNIKYLKISSQQDYNKTCKVKISNEDANRFMIQSSGFDYIDIDPFGSPNFLLNSSISRLSRRGILAVTATDTGCLAGSFPKACQRKYWSVSKRNPNMHETGIRILIRKVQLIGADNDKALTPIFSYFKDHYFRIFFRCKKGKQQVDEIINLHGNIKDIGPLWLGSLSDKDLTKDMIKTCTKYSITRSKIPDKDCSKDKSSQKACLDLINTIQKESVIDTIGFFNIPFICKTLKIPINIKLKDIMSMINKKGYKASLTHFAKNSIRSNIPEKDLIKILKR